MSQASNAGRVFGVHLNPSGSWTAVVSNLLEQLVCKLAMRNGIAELRAMDDRYLADIGLTRQQVEYIARYGRWPTVKRSGL
jgi:uncharacterized protein YjiS (DUF1127 family)